jgi:hypothetical protein
MCGCSSFTGNRPSEITTDEFTGNRPSYITSDFDGETDAFDNFFTKKQRDRRKQIKEGMASGLSRDEARKQALASLPKTKLSELIEKIKNGENINVIQTPLGDITLDTKIDEKLDELSNALKDTDANQNDIQPTFFEKNKMYIIGGAVLIAGIVVYMKFIKK